MAEHLKTKPEYFQATIDRRKLFEIRKNDRNFKPGDRYILEEFEGVQYTPACPVSDICAIFQNVYEEEEAVAECSLYRESCFEYSKEIYTGRDCLIKIKEVFDLTQAGLPDYVAFTFDILNIRDKRRGD